MLETKQFLEDKFMEREVFAYPRIADFYNLLQDLLHMELESLFLEHRFTMFINALERNETKIIHRYQDVPLIYAGIPRQRELLEGEVRNWLDDLNEDWNYLDSTELSSDRAIVTTKSYRAFNTGTYELSDIVNNGSGKLSDYFEAILHPEYSYNIPSKRQEAEFAILSEYFDLDADRYLSVPLIQFGEFDGIVHIVYSAKDHPNLTPKNIAKLIKSFSVRYEDLVLNWDLVGRNMEKSEIIQLTLTDVFYEHINKNPILKQLEYDKYYKKYLPYFKERIRLNDRVIHSKIYSPYLRAAIISIMIDSYAHNISAHSLIALNWWFKRRADHIQGRQLEHQADIQEVEDILEENITDGYDKDRVLELIQPWLQGGFVKDEEEEYDIVKYAGSLDREIHPLIKFLMQKGAFWSGIARDNHFGGEAASLFDVLWSDFINNPLYLGTIAKSEDIFRISLYITKYASRPTPGEEFISCVQPKKVVTEGEFVVIDIKNMRSLAYGDDNMAIGVQLSNGDVLKYSDFSELEDMSAFVRPGTDYAVVKQLLEETMVFFPGEVIGRHAFFTMLENEIRNVKHYKGDDLRSIQKNGLQLNIALEETGVRGGNKPDEDRELYRMGVWIGTPTVLSVENSRSLVHKKFEVMMEDIMDTETFAPRLGGTFQDKICAGMLFNNKFAKVQNGDETAARDKSKDTDRDNAYFPWIIPAVSSEGNPHYDMEVSRRMKESPAQFKEHFSETRGFFKKYFYLWKAATIRQISRMITDDDFVWENLARFKFISLNAPHAEKMELWRRVRHNGVIRIVGSVASTDANDAKSTLKAYKMWFKEWFFESSRAINILVDGLTVGRLEFKHDSEKMFNYYHGEDLLSRPQEDCQLEENLLLAHGGFSNDLSTLRYRSHGIYKMYFMEHLEVPDQHVHKRDLVRLMEFMETISTDVVIFDNRIHNRIKNNNRIELFANSLKLSIYGEEIPHKDENNNWVGSWEEIKEKHLSTAHFFVMHLSYIEKLLLLKYGDHKDYSDENVGLFIKEEILPHVLNDKGEVRGNFIFVITSGRGRMKWLKRLENKREYQPFINFTIFRPVESLITGIEDALGRKDDIELKSNLTKVLFGS